MTLEELAGVLITPYEEIKTLCGGEEVLFREELAERCLAGEKELLDKYGNCYVATVDCYYTGDHMALELAVV